MYLVKPRWLVVLDGVSREANLDMLRGFLEHSLEKLAMLEGLSAMGVWM